MANNEITNPIPARLKNVTGGHVAGAEDIIDDALGKEQSDINQERINDIEQLREDTQEDIQRIEDKVDEIGDAIQFDEDGDLVTLDGDDFSDPESRAKIPTIGAIKDGADTLGIVYDVSAKYPTAGPNNDGKFTLEYILSPSNVDTLIPLGVRKGGMSISFVQTSDNKYVQWRYMSSSTAVADFTNVANWQGVDDEPTAGSDNLVKSGGIYPIKESADESAVELAEIFNKVGIGIEISAISGITKKAGFNAAADSVNSRIRLASNAGTDSYYVVLAKPVDIYFNAVSAEYLAVLKGEDYDRTESFSSTIDIYCTNPARYRNTDGNLPTSASKLSFDAGDVMVFTITSDEDAEVYGIANNYSVKDSFKNEVLSEINQELTETNQELENLTDDIFDTVPASVEISEIDGITKLSGCNAVVSVSPAGINVSRFEGFDSYYVEIENDCSVYFNSISSAYLAILHGDNFTGTQTSGSTTYLLCSNAVRYRNTESNLPTAQNPLVCHAGDVICFSITENSDDLVYGLTSEKVVSESFAKEVAAKNNEDCYLKYVSGSGPQSSTERVEVFIPTNGGFIQYFFVHTVSASMQSDIWRMSVAYKTDNNFNIVAQLVEVGEWEVALSLAGRWNFSGGAAHGDQKIIADPLFFVDGKMVDITSLTDMTKFKQLRIVESDIMYDPGEVANVFPGSSPIAKHGSVHIFTNEGLEIDQSVEWLVNDTLSACYMAMFPVKKTAADKMVLDTDYAKKDITYGYTNNVNKALLYKESDGTMLEFEIPVYPSGTIAVNGNYLITDNGSDAYHKEYFYVCSTGAITNGTLWKSITKYRIG